MSFAVRKWDTNVYSDGDANTTVYAEFDCDTVEDLPARDYMAGYVLQCGSKAHVIVGTQDYEMKSNGQWVLKEGTDLQSLVSQISALSNDIQGAQGEIAILQTRASELESAAALLIDNGAKNMLEMTHSDGSITRYGVTCTWNRADGTMTLTGSHAAADSTAIFEFYSGAAADQRQIEPGSYHLAGVPAGGSTSTYRGALTSITGAVDTGSGADFSIETSTYLAFRILVSGTVDFGSGKVFQPMVCPSEYWQLSKKIVPYAPTNRDIYLAMN